MQYLPDSALRGVVLSSDIAAIGRRAALSFAYRARNSMLTHSRYISTGDEAEGSDDDEEEEEEEEGDEDDEEEDAEAEANGK